MMVFSLPQLAQLPLPVVFKTGTRVVLKWIESQFAAIPYVNGKTQQRPSGSSVSAPRGHLHFTAERNENF